MLTTATQTNVTSLGTLTSLTLSGAISGVTNLSLNGTISGGTSISATSLIGTLTTVAQPNITSVGTLTSLTVSASITTSSLSLTTLTLGGTNILASATEINTLAGVTNGTGAANKSLTLDASRNITNINSLSTDTLLATTLTGTLSTVLQPNIISLGTLTSLNTSGKIITTMTNNTSTLSSYQEWVNGSVITKLYMSNVISTFGTHSNHPMLFTTNNNTNNCLYLGINGNVNVGANASTSYKMNIEGSINCLSLNINGTYLNSTATELNTLAGITSGAASASKAIVLDNALNITGINSLSSITLSATNLTGTLTTASQPNITSLGTLSSLAISTTLSSGGFSFTNSTSLSTLGIYILASGGHQQIGSTSNNDFSLISNNTRRLTVRNNGNIGINTISAAYLLDVNGSLNSTSFYINGIQVTSTATELNYLSGLTAGTASASKAILMDASRNITNINSLTATSLTGTLTTAAQTAITSVGTLTSLTLAGALSGVTNLTLSGTISGATTITATSLTGSLTTAAQTAITSVGNLTSLAVVGNTKIGNVSGAAGDMLHLEGNISTSLGIQIENRNSTDQCASHIAFMGYHSTNNDYDLAKIKVLYSYQSASFGYGILTFLTRNSSSATEGTERMRIDAAGNIGINTITPSYKLDVNGNINSTSLYLNGTQLIAAATELNTLASVTAGTASASKAIVLDSNKDITGIRILTTSGTASGIRATNTTATSSANILCTSDTYSMEFGTRGSSSTNPNTAYLYYNGAYRMLIDSSGNIGFGTTPNSTYKVNVGGTLNSTSLYLNGTQITSTASELNSLSGSTATSTQLNYLSGVTAGTASALKAVVLDSSLNISGINVLNLNSTASTRPLTMLNSSLGNGNGTSFTLGKASAVDQQAEITFTYISTTGLSYLSLGHYGTPMTLNVLSNGKVGIGNTSPNYTLDITGSLNVSSNIYINGTILSSSYTTGVTEGTAAASKALITDSSLNIAGINKVSISSTNQDHLTLTNSSTTGNCNVKFNSNARSWELGSRGSSSSPANTFYLYDNTASTMRLVVDTNGKLGLGTSSPVGRIDMGSTASDQLLLIYNGTTSAYGFGANSSLLKCYSGSSAGIAFYHSASSSSTGSEIMRANSGGVGIFNTSPSYALDVNGTINCNSTINTSNGSLQCTGRIRTSASGYGFQHILGGGQEMISYVDSGEGRIGMYSQNAFCLLTNNTTRIYISPTNGYVGIGTTSPNFALDVVASNSWTTDGATWRYRNNSGSNGSFYNTSTTICAKFNNPIAVGTEIYITSDVRIKTNINEIPIEFAKAFIIQNKPVSFNYIESRGGTYHYGYIAQDLARNGYEELITLVDDDKMKEIIHEDGGISPASKCLHVAYQNIIPILATNIKYIYQENEIKDINSKNQENEIKKLKDENQKLINKIQDLDNRLKYLENIIINNNY